MGSRSVGPTLRMGEDPVRPMANTASMDSAPAAFVETVVPHERVHGWNWGLLAALGGCVAFWSVVVAGVLVVV